MSILEKPEIQEWLAECRTSTTRRSYESRIKRFFEWFKGSYEEFIKLEPKDLRHAALKYQSEHFDENWNSVNSVLTALSSFASYLEKPVSFKGKRVKPRPDIDSHVFSNGDLSKMFDVASTKEKAILSLICSLGWEISAVLELDRKTLSSLVARARSENTQFIFFNAQRRKTGAPRIGVLNPLALEWLDKWLSESQNVKARKRKFDKKTKDRAVSEIFDLTAEAVNKILRRLARDAQIVSTGRVHVHKIRGWVMSGLSRAGFNEFQIKYLVGKAIPLTDMTYLQTRSQEIEERYPKAYEQYLNIKPAKIVQIVDEDLKQRVAELETLRKENIDLKFKMNQLATSTQSLETLLKRVEELERKMQNKD